MKSFFYDPAARQGSFKFALQNLRMLRLANPNTPARLARNRRTDDKRGYWWRIAAHIPGGQIKVLDAWGQVMGDAPAVKPTPERLRYLQMVGRGIRPFQHQGEILDMHIEQEDVPSGFYDALLSGNLCPCCPPDNPVSGSP